MCHVQHVHLCFRYKPNSWTRGVQLLERSGGLCAQVVRQLFAFLCHCCCFLLVTCVFSLSVAAHVGAIVFQLADAVISSSAHIMWLSMSASSCALLLCFSCLAIYYLTAFCLNLLLLFDIWSDLRTALFGAQVWTLLCVFLVCVLLVTS